MDAHTDLAARQHGLVSRSQLRDREMTTRQIDRLVTLKRLLVVRRGVYRVPGAPESWEQQLMAACLAAWDTARVSHRAAAALWGLVGFAPDLVEITVEPGRRPHLDDLVVHESNRECPGHRVVRHGIPVTSVARTLVDLSSLLPPWRLGRVVDDAVRRKLTTMKAYERVARDMSRRGRRRSTFTRAVLDARLGVELGESAGEHRLRTLLVRSGLPAPVAQHRIRIGNRTIRVDFAYPEHRVVIEYDGWEFHGARSVFEADRARDNELELLGYSVLRFTSASTPDDVVRTVRAALTRRSAS